MLVKIESAAVFGLDGISIKVEIDASRGLPGQSIVGLPDLAVKESKDRVRCAIVNSGFEFPANYFTINLAPASIRKEGPIYDLPIALGLLCSSGQIKAKEIDDCFFLGELSLNGEVRKAKGILPMCHTLSKKGIKKVFVPKENADEAALIEEIEVIGVSNLKETAEYVSGEAIPIPHKIDLGQIFSDFEKYDFDFSEIKGQLHAKRAMEIAAAGGHNIIMVGPPGSGKTMLAKRIQTILPPMSLEEAIESTKIYSVSGLLKGKNFIMTKRPFRSPHHTTSDIGIIGGGRLPRPGEVSLSHLGVLFLDELPEFSREVIEVLREPLEEGLVTLSRAAASITYPANFMLIASMNPCPCGNFMDTKKICKCSQSQIQKYWAKLSSPFLDRIDIHIEVPRIKKEDYCNAPSCERSEDIRKRVIKARRVQTERFKTAKCNAKMTPKEIKKFCALQKESEDLLNSAVEKFGLSARGYDRVIKVARTIADLEEEKEIKTSHLAEALQYRSFDKRF